MTIETLAALGAIYAVQTPAPTSGPITLDDAVAIAQRNAFSVRLQQSRVEQSRQAVIGSEAALGPKVNAAVAYTRYGKETTAKFGATPIVISPLESKTITTSLSLPLDIAGNSHRLVRASEAQLRASRQSLNSTLNDARQNARSAYFTVLRAQAYVGVAKQALSDAEARLKQAQQQFAQQQVAAVDVQRFEAQVASSQADLISAENQLRLAQMSLNQVLARPIESSVEVVDVVSLPNEAVDADSLATIAQGRRPELLAIQENLTALANIRRAQEATLNPSLSLSVANVRNIDAKGLSAQDQTNSLSLALNIPIFDMGATRAKVKQARQDEEQAKIQLEQARLGVSIELRSAATNLTSARARYENAVKQVALAEEVFRLARVRQDAGEGTYIEVIDAETSLTAARNSLVSARYDILVAYAQLQRALGSDDIPGATGATPQGGK